MRTLVYENYDDFACAIADRYDDITEYDDLKSIDIIAKYEDARGIIRELINVGYDIAFIEGLAEPEYNGYVDEFVISIMDNDIWCEPAMRENGYLHPEASVVYVFSNCNSKIISYIRSDEVYEVEMNDCEYYGTEHCDGYCNCDKGHNNKTELSSDVKKHETSNVKESYKVNGKSVTKDEYENKLKEFNKKFMDHVGIVLNDYSNFMNEMTEWNKLLGW